MEEGLPFAFCSRWAREVILLTPAELQFILIISIVIWIVIAFCSRGGQPAIDVQLAADGSDPHCFRITTLKIAVPNAVIASGYRPPAQSEIQEKRPWLFCVPRGFTKLARGAKITNDGVPFAGKTVVSQVDLWGQFRPPLR